tara:strand:- start:347 stop:742 length:396 start_codon:yes stop_codon:yes gene_type:complete
MITTENLVPKLTITVRELLISIDSGAVARLAALEIPVEVSWQISRLVRALQSEYQDANAARVKLFTDKNSEAIRSGTADRQIKSGHEAEYFNSPLFAQVVSFDYEPVSIATLGSIKISPADILNLGPVITG